ncbi:hypothetical protein [Nocardia altamirensis]|uniref:hypothetical protein n=1 Tax=Nocardia altamirensis TaxID=472158 RepID=UPI0008404388|nr:hypothetical protein [Nocardia altamirensis]
MIALGTAATVPTVLAPAATAQSDGAKKFVKLTLDSVTPTAVTTTSDPVLTVAGTLTNIGDRVVENIRVRMQRAAAITTPSNLRATLQLEENSYDLQAPFQAIATELKPFERKQFSMRIPLRQGSGSSTSLAINEPGVYPLLLNVNGKPDYGVESRLDDARFLLPVLGLPPTSNSADASAAVPMPAGAPVPTTLLWPLADRPRVVAGVAGSVDGKIELTDDELAKQLDKGGRLDELLGAVETVVGPAPGRDRTLASSVCLAIDPDLLLTAQAMTKGYRVLASPSDPGGAIRDGTGGAQAKSWLDRLRTLAASMCTVALPFGQVDLDALAAVNDPDLSARAINAPAELIDTILTTKSVRGVSLPDSGSIDGGAGTLLRSHGLSTAVLADTAVAEEGKAGTSEAVRPTSTTRGRAQTTVNQISQSEPAAPPVVRLPAITAAAPPPAEPVPPANPVPPNGNPPADPALHAATFDIWSATALAAVGSNPPTPSFTPAKVRYDVTIDSRTARLQDALGAMSWSALNPQPDQPRSLLLVPPQQWSANRDEATTLLRQLELLVRSNLAAPRPFKELIEQPPDPQPYELDYLPQAAKDAVPDRFFDPVRDQARRISELMRALIDVPEAQLKPGQFLNPLRDDLIRTLSLSDRRAGDASQANTFAQRRIDQSTRTLDKIYHSVTVLPPGGVYTLASEQSPLLLVAQNDLPVSVQVRIKIEVPAAVKIEDLGVQDLPPKGKRSFQIPTEVRDSETFIIPISLTTPDGIPLGNATQVSVRSNAYGQVLAIITACAGVLLFLLAGRRLWRRFRGQPDPADEGFDPNTRRRVNRYRRAKKRVIEQQEQQEAQ